MSVPWAECVNNEIICKLPSRISLQVESSSNTYKEDKLNDNDDQKKNKVKKKHENWKGT